MVRRRPAIAALFALLGIPICGYLFMAAFLSSTIGGHVHQSPTLMVLPFVAYFVGGCFSAVVRTMKTRRVAAAICHLAPLGVFVSTGSEDAFGMVMIIGVMYAIFGVAWVRMVFDETSPIYRFTERAISREAS